MRRRVVETRKERFQRQLRVCRETDVFAGDCLLFQLFDNQILRRTRIVRSQVAPQLGVLIQFVNNLGISGRFALHIPRDVPSQFAWMFEYSYRDVAYGEKRPQFVVFIAERQRKRIIEILEQAGASESPFSRTRVSL